MPEARVLGSNTTGYNVTNNSSNGLYQAKEYKPKNLSYDPKTVGYDSKPYDIKDTKIYETKVLDPFKQKVYTYDTVKEYDHYYTYGLPEPKPETKKKKPPPPPKAPKVKKEKSEVDLFPQGFKRSTVGMVKRTLNLSKSNKVNPQPNSLPDW